MTKTEDLRAAEARPTFPCDRRTDGTVRFREPCPECGKRHVHGSTPDLEAGKAEHRVSDCTGFRHGGYFIQLFDATP